MLLGILFAGAPLSIIDGAEHRKHGFARHWALAKEPQFSCVGAFVDGCTGGGVWIGGNVVLTTAHSVVDRSTLGYRNREWYKYQIMDGHGKLHEYRVKDFHATTAYKLSIGNDNYWGRWGADIAVAELDRPIKIPGVSPAVVSFSAPKPGDVLTLVSYGHRGNTLDGTDKRFGSGFGDNPPRPLGFRVGVRRVDTLDHNINLLFRQGADIDLQGITSSCDSGGGAFQNIGGEWKLMGIICTSQMPTLEGVMKTSEIDMGVTATKPFAGEILTGRNTGNFELFERHNPKVQ
jgi:hypothetical protein